MTQDITKPGTMTEFILAGRRAKRLAGKVALPIFGQATWTPFVIPEKEKVKRMAKRRRPAQESSCAGCSA